MTDYKELLLPATVTELYDTVYDVIKDIESTIVRTTEQVYTDPRLLNPMHVAAFSQIRTQYCNKVTQYHYDANDNIVRNDFYLQSMDTKEVLPIPNITVRGPIIVRPPVIKSRLYKANGWIIYADDIGEDKLRLDRTYRSVPNVSYGGKNYASSSQIYCISKGVYQSHESELILSGQDNGKHHDKTCYRLYSSEDTIIPFYSKTVRKFNIGSGIPEQLLHKDELGDLQPLANDEDYWLLYSHKCNKYIAGCREFTKQEAIAHWSEVNNELNSEHYEFRDNDRLDRANKFLEAIYTHNTGN